MRALLWVVFGLVVAGCTVVRGSGKGGDVRLKVYTKEHPLTLSRSTFPGDGYDLLVERAFLVEARTVFGPQYWRVFVHGAIVNGRGEKLPLEALSKQFTIVGHSGKVYPAYAHTRGSRHATGWLLQEHTKEPTHLPPDQRGLVEIFTGLDGKETPDAPAAFTFLHHRAEVR
jgi:hypothetical protein